MTPLNVTLAISTGAANLLLVFDVPIASPNPAPPATWTLNGLAGQIGAPMDSGVNWVVYAIAGALVPGDLVHVLGGTAYVHSFDGGSLVASTNTLPND